MNRDQLMTITFKKRKLKNLPFFICAALFTNMACAKDASDTSSSSTDNFSAVVTIGMEYNDTLSVTEIDATSTEDDTAIVVDLDLRYKKPINSDTNAELGYSFSRSLYDDFDNFDIQSHLISGDINHKFGDIKGGLTYRFFDFELDNDPLLDLQQISPYFTRFIGKEVFIRGSYTYSKKEYDTFTTRDAKTNSIELDAYYFIDGSQLYISGGYSYRDEDANAPQYDYDSNILKAAVTKKIKVAEYDSKLKLSYRHEERDYSSITPSIGAVRDDTRRRAKLSWEFDISDDVKTILEYQHTNNKSNLASADYNQNVAGIMVEYAFK